MSALEFEQLFNCSGEVALITGGAGGIGLTTAETLARAGATVAICDLEQQRPEAAAANLRVAGLAVHGFVADLSKPAEVERLFHEVSEVLGTITIVVANAGAALDEKAPAEDLTVLDSMYQLHVRSVMQLAYLSLPAMAAHGGGSFIVMSSIAGMRGNSLIDRYGVTKAANAQIARNLAVQWGTHNIRANAISPGVIDTRFAEFFHQQPEVATQRMAKTPLGRFGTVAEVAGTVLWLVSPAGGFVSGQNIVIDGGTVVNDQ